MRNSGEETSPPHTPSDSSTADEQILPASDYFFLNYPFFLAMVVAGRRIEY
jgi:hypothetical protein